MSDYTVYILQNPEGKFYIGQTQDLDKRLKRHNENRSQYTKKKGPWKLVHQETFSDRSKAMKRERQLKKWRRELLLKLIDKP